MRPVSYAAVAPRGNHSSHFQNIVPLHFAKLSKHICQNFKLHWHLKGLMLILQTPQPALSVALQAHAPGLQAAVAPQGSHPDLAAVSICIPVSCRRMRRVSKLQWHPEAATQVMVACGDDASPVVQLWDLRYASAPTLELQEHTKASLAGRGPHRVGLGCVIQHCIGSGH